MNRALFKSMGYSDYDLERPLIGIANSWNRVVPGHYNLNLVSEYVKQGVYQAGGTPVEFGVIAACDGIAQGHKGMHYILPTRDLIANDIEMMVELGYCSGIENYSRYLSGRAPGEPPPTLIEYLPKNSLLIIDESHVTVPQLGAMYKGDRARKLNLV